MCVQGVMGWVGGRPAAGEAAVLLYNRDASELRHKKDLVVHIGVNGWDGDTTEVPMAKDDRAMAAAEGLGEGDWYTAKVGVPKRATIVDFVISDTNKQARAPEHSWFFFLLLFSASPARQTRSESAQPALCIAAHGAPFDSTF